MSEVAIVGAGMAGLAAAHLLGREGTRAAVFEKSRGLSGRAATRRRAAEHYDHGANFFRTDEPEIRRLIHEELPTDELIEITGDVLPFTADGTIGTGDAAQNGRPKYSYRSGINLLGKLLAANSATIVHRETKVAALSRNGGSWVLHDQDGEELGSAARVILTPPAPQVAEILARSRFDDGVRDQLCAAFGKLRYHCQFSFVFGFDGTVPRPLPFHALVSSDGRHPIAWVGFENDKPGHVADGRTILVVQMAPAWSERCFDQSPESLLPAVGTALRTLLPALGDPAWWDCQRWRFSHPAATADPTAARSAESLGLFIAGDALAGKGRIPLALKSGRDAARRILARAGPAC